MTPFRDNRHLHSHAFGLALREDILRDLCNPRPSRIKGSSRCRLTDHRCHRGYHSALPRLYQLSIRILKVGNAYKIGPNKFEFPYSQLNAGIKCWHILRQHTLAERVNEYLSLWKIYRGIIKLAKFAWIVLYICRRNRYKLRIPI